MKPLKVKELIELLMKQDPEDYVITEGCDCYGDSCGVEKSVWNEGVYGENGTGITGYKEHKAVCINRI